MANEDRSPHARLAPPRVTSRRAFGGTYKLPDHAESQSDVGRLAEDDKAWYHNHIKDPTFSGLDKINTDFFEKPGYSGVRNTANAETFHHFQPRWDVDTASSLPFVPAPRP